jgi:hypothetical protein
MAGLASEWDIIGTGSYRRAGRTPMAVEFNDLVLEVGRPCSACW